MAVSYGIGVDRPVSNVGYIRSITHRNKAVTSYEMGIVRPVSNIGYIRSNTNKLAVSYGIGVGRSVSSSTILY